MPDFLKKFPFLKDPEPPALWKAARDGDVETIKKLVAGGANVNTKHDGDTPLHEAAYHKQAEAVKELVKLGGKINAKNDEGNTPVKLAVQNGADTNLVELLIQLGADVNKGPSEPLGEAAAGGDERMVRCLLDHGANPNGPARSLIGPLCAAAASGNVAVVQMLLEAGAKVNPEFRQANSSRAESALDMAAFRGHQEVIRILLAAGANPNYKNSTNATPLVGAVLSKNAEIVQMLLQAGAEVNVISNNGTTSLDLAERDELDDIIKILRQAGAKRGNELPKLENKEEPSTSWELKDSMVLGADVELWPAKAGNANLKIEITKDDYNRSFLGTLEYRVARSERNPEPWFRVFGELDEDGEFASSIEIKLIKGENIIQFRIKDKDDKDFIELEGWPVSVD